jgi:non-ribosomal peptide synthetase component F
LERSVATVVSLLAILKAGCTYLPLDLSYPPDRLAHMVSDSAARLVITHSASPLSFTPKTLFIDHRDSWETQSQFSLEANLSAGDPAYIIYTSGSTGKPKGVAVPHSAAVNLAFGRLNHDPISTGDRILAAISVGFDVSIGQLLLPLISGATIVIAGDLRMLTPPEFWSFIQTYQVTHINSVPSFFESILDAAPKSASLTRLMLGGEPLSSALVRRLQKHLPETQVFNMYGPTEACIDATAYGATGLESSAALPIGKPLPNYRACILNEYLEPVGIGVPTSTSPLSLPSNSSPIHSARPVPAFIRQATVPAGDPMAISSSSAVPIHK